MARAFYRSYVHNHRRAAQVRRLHILREDGKLPRRQGLCGAAAWGVTRSEPVVLDPMPASPPAGLSWCPACVGKLAELRGRLAAVAADLAEGVASCAS